MTPTPSPLLVITRKYPPEIGGMESYSFNLVRELKLHQPLRVLALKRSKRHLVWFLPYALAVSLWSSCRASAPRVHLCDGLLAPIGWLLKLLSRSRVSASVHGLDVTFAHPLYARFIPYCLRHLDQIVCVSRSTRNECLKRGIPAERCVVIPNGIRPDELSVTGTRRTRVREVETGLERSFQGRRILLTVGRLVERKGVRWFVDQVMPRLAADWVYVVVGSGPESAAIQETVDRLGLQNRVVLAGQQPDRIRNCLLHIADAFIMPNISVPGDVEGFGIVALEAGACGLPVIASAIQGIRDAVIDGVTGHLINEKDAQGFVERIETLDLDPEHIRSTVLGRFGWDRIGLEYVHALSESELDRTWAVIEIGSNEDAAGSHATGLNPQPASATHMVHDVAESVAESDGSDGVTPRG